MNILLLLLAATIALISYHPQKGLIFPLSGIVYAYIYAAFTIVFVIGVSSFLLKKIPRQERIFRSLVLSIIITGLGWIQLDYFLNSAFQISSLQLYEKNTLFHIIQFMVVAAVCLVCIYLIRTKKRLNRNVIAVHLLAFAGVLIFLLVENRLAQTTIQISTDSAQALKDIFIITVDSLEKEQLENKSYFPRLSKQLGEFEKADYHYTNACCTHAALSVLYTGQTVDRTKVSYLPAYLKGEFRSKNLPNFLKRLGYETHSYTSATHGNARKIGIDGGFDFIEGKKVPFFESHGYMSYFKNQTQTIMVLRKLYVELLIRFEKFFIDPKAINPFDEIKNEKIKGVLDKQKTDYLVKLSGKEKKIFAHVHYLGMHAQKGHNKKKIAKILNQIDSQLNEVILNLKKSRRWKDTLFIISSDHGMRWATDKNLPLYIKLPQMKQNHKIGLEYTQTADITPTLLDLLELDVEFTFSGKSIFQENPNHRRFIVMKNFFGKRPWRAPHYKIRQITVRDRETTTIIDAENFIWDEKGYLALDKILKKNKSNL